MWVCVLMSVCERGGGESRAVPTLNICFSFPPPLPFPLLCNPPPPPSTLSQSVFINFIVLSKGIVTRSRRYSVSVWPTIKPHIWMTCWQKIIYSISVTNAGQSEFLGPGLRLGLGPVKLVQHILFCSQMHPYIVKKFSVGYKICIELIFLNENYKTQTNRHNFECHGTC